MSYLLELVSNYPQICLSSEGAAATSKSLRMRLSLLLQQIDPTRLSVAHSRLAKTALTNRVDLVRPSTRDLRVLSPSLTEFSNVQLHVVAIRLWKAP